MKIGTFTAVLVSFPHFLSVFMYHLCSFCTGCLKRWLDFVLARVSARSQWLLLGILDKSQIFVATSKNSEKNWEHFCSVNLKVDTTTMPLFFQIFECRNLNLRFVSMNYGGFHFVDLIIKELKNQMTCYNSMPLIGWFIQHSDWRANLVKDWKREHSNF